MLLAVEQDLAAGDRVAGVAHHDVGQGRLAGAVGAHEGVYLTLSHDEVDAAQNRVAFGFGVEVAKF